MPDEPKVLVRGLEVDFTVRKRIVRALDRVDLDIARGEFLVIVGPSGCGKTTLLRAMAGLEQPTGGRIEVRPAPPGDGDGPKTESAMVFQEHGVFPWMTVTDNVAFGLKAQGVPTRRRREIAGRYISKVGLDAFAAAYPHQLSGGMRQRVSLARAFATDPQLLLMDEPFAALDEQTKLVLQDLLLTIWEETAKTVVYVTHSLDEALVLADRVLVMSGRPGRVREIVDVSAVFERPRSVESVRTDPRYGEMFGRIWNLLAPETAGVTA